MLSYLTSKQLKLYIRIINILHISDITLKDELIMVG